MASDTVIADEEEATTNAGMEMGRAVEARNAETTEKKEREIAMTSSTTISKDRSSVEATAAPTEPKRVSEEAERTAKAKRWMAVARGEHDGGHETFNLGD